MSSNIVRLYRGSFSAIAVLVSSIPTAFHETGDARRQPHGRPSDHPLARCICVGYKDAALINICRGNSSLSWTELYTRKTVAHIRKGLVVDTSRIQKVEQCGFRQYGFGNAVALRTGTFFRSLCGLQISAEMSRALDDAAADGQPRSLKVLQRRFDVRGFQSTRQGCGIARRFADAGADMRPRHKGRVPDDRHPAESHAWGFEVINWLQDRLLNRPHDLAALRREQPLGGCSHRRDRLLTDQGRRNRNLM